MPRSTPRWATPASLRLAQPNEMSDILKPVCPSGRYARTRAPTHSWLSDCAFGVAPSRNSSLPYLQLLTPSTPPATARLRNIARRVSAVVGRRISSDIPYLRVLLLRIDIVCKHYLA